MSHDLSERILFFDTETSDMINFRARNSDPSQPWVVQLAAVLTDGEGKPLHQFSCICNSGGRPMGDGAEDVHKIPLSTCNTVGLPHARAMAWFMTLVRHSTLLVAHNKAFDIRILKILGGQLGGAAKTDAYSLDDYAQICTMVSTTKLCQLPKPSGKGGFKWPKLEELYFFLFGKDMNEKYSAHDALEDVRATIECYFELKKRGFWDE